MSNIYTVTEAATKLGISAKTLRRWEETDRFHSSRTLGGQRRYSTEDLQILDAISHNIIPSDQELLSTSQAATLAGVGESTITRWEQTGKIHTFVTSGGTYFIKSQLLAKLNSLKSVEPIITQPTSTPTLQPLQPPQTTAAPTRELVSPSLIHDFQLLALNLFASISLIMGYHILTYKPISSAPTNPVISNQIDRVETTIDPKIELLKNIIDNSGNLNTAGMMRISGQLITSNFVLSPIARPLAPVAGTVYFDAGSQTLELYTGTAWAIISPSAPVTSPTPSTQPKSSVTPLR